jgi:hypothetical protein
MRPDDIRKLYRAETEATTDEARATREDARTDPDMARNLILTCFALASEDPAFDALFHLFLRAATMDLITTHATTDDAFALRMADHILNLMDRMAEAERARRVPRGKPKTA